MSNLLLRGAAVLPNHFKTSPLFWRKEPGWQLGLGHRQRGNGSTVILPPMGWACFVRAGTTPPLMWLGALHWIVLIWCWVHFFTSAPAKNSFQVNAGLKSGTQSQDTVCLMLLHQKPRRIVIISPHRVIPSFTPIGLAHWHPNENSELTSSQSWY